MSRTMESFLSIINLEITINIYGYFCSSQLQLVISLNKQTLQNPSIAPQLKHLTHSASMMAQISHHTQPSISTMHFYNCFHFVFTHTTKTHNPIYLCLVIVISRYIDKNSLKLHLKLIVHICITSYCVVTLVSCVLYVAI